MRRWVMILHMKCYNDYIKKTVKYEEIYLQQMISRLTVFFGLHEWGSYEVTTP